MRKVYRPKAWYDATWYDLEESTSAMNSLSHTVYEEEYDPVPSGILDASGEMIYYHIQKDPIGFIHFGNND